MNSLPDALKSQNLPSKTEKQELAEFALDPLNHAAISLEHCSDLAIHQEVGFSALADQLAMVTRDIHDGDTKHLQTMLFAQSIVLDSIFQNLLRRGIDNGCGNIREPMLRLALKAQNQSRKSLAVLAAMHQPKAAVLVQNNQAVNQQINNDVTLQLPNELLAMENING